jgi:hypothetical protein
VLSAAPRCLFVLLSAGAGANTAGTAGRDDPIGLTSAVRPQADRGIGWQGFCFRLEMVDGAPAEPPTDATAVPNWSLGGGGVCGHRRSRAKPGDFPQLAGDGRRQSPVGLLVARLHLGRSFSCTTLALLRFRLETRPIWPSRKARAPDVTFSTAMHIEGVGTIHRCDECEAYWLPADETRWQAWLTDEPPEVVFYCPDCAKREFGD